MATTRTTKRSIRIHSMPSGSRVHVRYARTLKSGLEAFFKEFLKPRGYKAQKVIGNMLIVQSKDGTEYTFVAYEEVTKK